MDEPTEKPNHMTVREAGRLGGLAVAKKHGPEFFARIGSAGGKATKAAHDDDYYQKMGKAGGTKGGQATRDKYGHEFFVDIGERGAARTKEILAAGKAALAAQAKTCPAKT